MGKYFKFEFFYLLIIIIWKPLLFYVLKFDAAGRTITILMLLVIGILMIKKVFFINFLKKPLAIWGVWVLYVAFNNLILGNGFGEEYPTSSFLTMISAPLITMVTINAIPQNNKNELLNILILAFFINILLFFIYDLDANENKRVGSIMNSNEIAFMALVLLMIIYLKYAYRNFSFVILILLSILPVITILLAGSRNAFFGLVMLVFTHIIVNRSKNMNYNIVKYSLAVLVFFISIIFVIENTLLGERLISTANQTKGTSIETDNKLLNMFGDRGHFYSEGWQVLMQHPFMGVGLRKFFLYNENSFAQHTEYMAQLSELGIIGFFLFFIFYFYIIKGLLRIRHFSQNRKYFEIHFAYIIMILVMISAMYMYNKSFMFTILGIVISYIYTEKSKYKKHNRLIKYLRNKSFN